MEKVIPVLNDLISSESETISFSIIEGEKNIVYSTSNWDISKDIDIINNIWNSNEVGDINILGKKYIIIQNTAERLIATSHQSEEGIVGYRDEERKIICKINIEGMKIQSFLIQLSRVLSTISSKKPYISENLILQRRPETEELTPKVISDTSRILEKLGLNRVGLSEDDAKVYLALLRKGEKGEKVGSLDKELDLKRTHIYRIIERLLQKDWVDKLAKTPKGAQFFTARPLNNLLDAFIKEKTEEIKILKGLKSIISDDYKNGWKIITEVEKDLKGQFDLDIQEIIGNEKDCGIVIYEYDRIIKGEENLDKVKLRLYSNKLETIILERKEIGKLKDLNEVKVDEIDIQDYYGAIISVSYKSGSKVEDKAEKDWNIVAKLVSIPIDNKIYIIWGSEEKFQILMDMILKIG
ncbi:MAG: helix-turn-helix domain-containing protein [Promethearchaeota archaeon]|jgi:predicted transcriptional regulator